MGEAEVEAGPAPGWPGSNMVEAAWGLIAAAYDGDWSKAPDGWQRAAAAWRDAYHERLAKERPGGRHTLAGHAAAELERARIEPPVARSIVNALHELASPGHSGGSWNEVLVLMERLLHREALSPLSDLPEEWEDRSGLTGTPMWQNRRDSRAISLDGGRTWWYTDARHPGERCRNGDLWGVLVRCPECSGQGTLHSPDPKELRKLVREPAGEPVAGVVGNLQVMLDILDALEAALACAVAGAEWEQIVSDVLAEVARHPLKAPAAVGPLVGLLAKATADLAWVQGKPVREVLAGYRQALAGGADAAELEGRGRG